jgi:hypothetical protein
MVDIKTFILVMGAKLLNCSILLYPDVGGWAKRKGRTVSKSEISEL